MADLALLDAEVETFAAALAVLAQRLAAVEAALGRPRVAAAPTAVSGPPETGGGDAAEADVVRLETVLVTYDEVRASLEARIATLEQALATFAPALPRVRTVPAAAPEPFAGAASRAALDRLQKRTVAFAATLAGFELRVAAAEDALDAFFGTVC